MEVCLLFLGTVVGGFEEICGNADELQRFCMQPNRGIGGGLCSETSVIETKFPAGRVSFSWAVIRHQYAGFLSLGQCAGKMLVLLFGEWSLEIGVYYKNGRSV